MALCVTRADNFDMEWRKTIQQQLYQHPDLAPILKNNEIAILFMGCVEPKGGSYLFIKLNHEVFLCSCIFVKSFIFKDISTMSIFTMDTSECTT